MNDSEARIARLLQAAATLYTSGHVREDAVHVALQLEAQVRTALDSEKRLKETQNGSGNKTHMDITISKDS
jgi:hypothetical protein